MRRDETQVAPCATGCGRKAPIRYSKHCNTCARRIARNGAPHATALDLKMFDMYRKRIAEALARHRGTKAVQGALTLAAELLTWQPTHDFSIHFQLRQQLDRLQNFAVTPEQIVQRVCEFFAWLHDNPLRTKREQEHKLAWAVLKLAPLRGWQARTHVLLLLNQLIEEEGLMQFAVGLRLKIEQDRTDRAQLVKDLGDYS
jgi:hypothetical protein